MTAVIGVHFAQIRSLDVIDYDQVHSVLFEHVRQDDPPASTLVVFADAMFRSDHGSPVQKRRVDAHEGVRGHLSARRAGVRLDNRVGESWFSMFKNERQCSFLSSSEKLFG